MYVRKDYGLVQSLYCVSGRVWWQAKKGR